MSIEKKLGKKPKTIDKRVLIDLTKKLCHELNKLSFDETKSLIDQKPQGDIKIIGRMEGVFHFSHDACTYLKEAIELIKNDPLYIDFVSEKKIEARYEDLVPFPRKFSAKLVCGKKVA